MPPTIGVVPMTGGLLPGFSTECERPSRMKTNTAAAARATGTRAQTGTPMASAMSSTLMVD